jgi:hypothetical protein
LRATAALGTETALGDLDQQLVQADYEVFRPQRRTRPAAPSKRDPNASSEWRTLFSLSRNFRLRLQRWIQSNRNRQLDSSFMRAHLNQPVRMIFTIPSATLAPVLLGFAVVAARIWRVSRQAMGSQIACRAACSQAKVILLHAGPAAIEPHGAAAAQRAVPHYIRYDHGTLPVNHAYRRFRERYAKSGKQFHFSPPALLLQCSHIRTIVVPRRAADDGCLNRRSASS